MLVITNDDLLTMYGEPEAEPEPAPAPTGEPGPGNERPA